MAGVLVAVWIALAVGVAGFLGGAIFATARFFRAWRTFRRTSRNVSRGLGDLSAKAAATETRAVAASTNAAKSPRPNDTA